ncbi:tetratricopeptide repeat protein [Myxacorys almedinensis]|uniref:Tetratricopeptide repeat protein n=1 Tax=Myxacorys almedinensis A TaxID=2690445 RepID=A0A8J7ZCL3_9CYAN|nr:tetratricopeptide repeat protein [Myxacorys almedinensis]NDJ19500.1 tetratricopeptide repeat protein [Myxacorys almedinensis A]
MRVSNHRHTLPVILTLAVGVTTAGCDQPPDQVSASPVDDRYDVGLTDPAYYINLGKELRSSNKPNDAIAAYRRAIQIDLGSAEAYHELGNVLSGQRRSEEAIAAYRRAIQINPQDATAYDGLGNALSEQKRTEEAIAAYRRAIQVEPQDATAYAGLGNALMEQRRITDAIAVYQQALTLSKQPEHGVNAHTLALVGLGRALQAENQLDNAIAMYRRAIQISPTYTWTYIYLGYALTEQQQFQEANRNYQHVLKLPNVKKPKLGDSHALAHNGLGMVLQRQGKLQPAIQQYEQAVSLDLSYETGHKNLKGAKRLFTSQAQRLVPRQA